MDTKNRYDRLDPAAVSSIKFYARKLKRQDAVPGIVNDT